MAKVQCKCKGSRENTESNLHTNINSSSVLLLLLVTGFSWIISWDIASYVKSVPLFLLVGVHFNNIRCKTKGAGLCLRW
jgi:hypothetical protein